MTEYPVKGMTAYHRQTLTNRMLGRRRPVTNLGPVGNIGDFYTVPLPPLNTVTVPLRRSSNTRKQSSRSSNRYSLKSSNTPSTLRDLERERTVELCKLLQAIKGPFDRNDGKTLVILRAIRFLTQTIESKYPAKMFTKPHLYYKQIADYIVHTVFDQDRDLDIEYLKELGESIGLYKKCRLTR